MEMSQKIYYCHQREPKPSHLAPGLAQNSSGMRIYRFAGATYTDTDANFTQKIWFFFFFFFFFRKWQKITFFGKKNSWTAYKTVKNAEIAWKLC